jgi:tryptophan synthase beta subunit
MRMYEILAAGCVPIFAGLHYSPLGGAMAFLPRELLEMARQLPGVVLNESAAMKGFTSITGYEEPLPALEVDASQFDDAAFRDVA